MGLALASENDPTMQSGARSDITRVLRERVAVEVAASRARVGDHRRAAVAALANVAVLWGSTIWLIFGARNWIAEGAGLVVCGLAVAHSIMRVHGYLHRREWSRVWLWDAMVRTLHPFLLRDWWRAKHHDSHHGATNVEGLDDDLATSRLVRVAPSARWRRWHRFQHRYVFLLAPFLLPAMAAKSSWYALTGRVGDLARTERPTHRATMVMLIDQWWHVGLVAVMALLRHSVIDVAGAFVVVMAIAGTVLLVVFSVQHTTQITTFPPAWGQISSREEQIIWALRGTANVATGSRVLSAFTAHLNHHVEHHLFPSIESRHLPAVRRAVRSVCSDFDLVYLEFPTYRAAIRSWLKYLRAMGRAPEAVPVAGKWPPRPFHRSSSAPERQVIEEKGPR